MRDIWLCRPKKPYTAENAEDAEPHENLCDLSALRGEELCDRPFCRWFLGDG
jgi:hypothetical protein